MVPATTVCFVVEAEGDPVVVPAQLTTPPAVRVHWLAAAVPPRALSMFFFRVSFGATAVFVIVQEILLPGLTVTVLLVLVKAPAPELTHVHAPVVVYPAGPLRLAEVVLSDLDLLVRHVGVAHGPGDTRGLIGAVRVCRQGPRSRLCGAAGGGIAGHGLHERDLRHHRGVLDLACDVGVLDELDGRAILRSARTGADPGARRVAGGAATPTARSRRSGRSCS